MSVYEDAIALAALGAVITIPAGGAVYTDIPWYGPLYLAQHYGNGKTSASGTGGDFQLMP